MEIPFNEILDVVRSPGDPRAAFNALRDIGKALLKSPVWDSIQTPNVEADIEAAAVWLTRNIAEYRPSGVYLGLDTLNEKGGRGKNVEIGMTNTADPAAPTMEWAWKCERYGEEHLVRGMFEVHKYYDAFGLKYETSQLADYLFYFGYSGTVLVSALERMRVSWNSLFVWGFHDGDIGFLARSSPHGITRLATFKEA